MTAPSYLPLNLAGVPAELLNQPWIGWRVVINRDGEPKKTPFQIGFPMEHASNDESKEASRAEIGTPQREPVRRNESPELKHWRNAGDVREVLTLEPELFDGFGIVLTAAAGLTFIDLDHVRDPETGALAPWAERMVNTFDSWTEVSVSGTGLHIFCRGQLPGAGFNSYLDGDPAMRIEAYSVARFAYLTGHVLHEGPVAERQHLVTLLAASVRPAGPSTVSPAGATRGAEMTPIPAGARNDTLFRLARGLVRRGLRGEALAAELVAVSHRRCVPVPPDGDVVRIARHAEQLPDRRPA